MTDMSAVDATLSECSGVNEGRLQLALLQVFTEQLSRCLWPTRTV